jgi:hypothetical protein
MLLFILGAGKRLERQEQWLERPTFRGFCDFMTAAKFCVRPVQINLAHYLRRGRAAADPQICRRLRVRTSIQLCRAR